MGTLMVALCALSPLHLEAQQRLAGLHFEPEIITSRESATLYVRVEGTTDEVVAVDISTNLANWTPFLTNRIVLDGVTVSMSTNQRQMFLRARTLSNGALNSDNGP